MEDNLPSLIALLLAITFGLVLSLIMTQLASVPSQQTKSSTHSLLSFPQHRVPFLLLHLGTWFILYTGILIILQRPWFTMIVVLSFQGILLLVNHAKYDSLREPFIFQDFEYFTDAIKHPRLYLPFFGIARTLIASFGFIIALIIGLKLEIPLTTTLSFSSIAYLCTFLLLLGIICLNTGLKYCSELTFNPIKDLHNLGQIGFFWAYWQSERTLNTQFKSKPVFTDPIACDPQKLPHIFAVQSESFFDVRTLSDQIQSNVLENFDLTKSQSCFHGRLQVPAWGANTVRTECAFLTGLEATELGIHQFNPYRLFAKQNIPNLVQQLKSTGYKTICIHPYPSSFYLRNIVFPRLGFDHFFDINSFTTEQREGQFIGDLAIADMLDQLLTTHHDDDSQSQHPLFIFIITMENHGPLHLEQPDKTNSYQFYKNSEPETWSDLTVYLQHLKNADTMVKRLKDSLSLADLQFNRKGIFCWYGDHVPIMNNIYNLIGSPDGLTDYFIWHTDFDKNHFENKEKNLAIEDLAEHLMSILTQSVSLKTSY